MILLPGGVGKNRQTEAEAIHSRSAEGIKIGLLLLSTLVGASAAFILFVLFLQTSAVSLVRVGIAAGLFIAISLAHYYLAVKWLIEKGALAAHSFVFGLLITAVSWPLLYPTPPFPLSPLLRPWADLTLQFEIPSSSTQLMLPLNNVKLIMDKDVLNAGAFNLVGSWERTASGLRLAPGAAGSLEWTGTVPNTITLSIQPPAVEGALTVYWNDIRSWTRLHFDHNPSVVIVEKSGLPWGYNLVLFVSSFISIAWALGLLLAIFGIRILYLERLASGKTFLWVVIILSILLTALTVKLQIDSLSGGMKYVATAQLARHVNVLEGRAPNPWQYRVLSEWIAEAFIGLAGALPTSNAVVFGFIALRVAQNIALFLLASVLYRKLSGSNLLGLAGMLLLASSMVNAYYDNDLAFNTYFDVIFYLLAGLLLLSRRYYAVVILTFFAALNRETSGVIPFLMTAAIVEQDERLRLRKFLPAFLALALFAGVFLGLRWLFPGRPIYIPYKHPPGVSLLLYNITRQFTWDQLWKTLGLVPFLGLASLPAWPRLWRRFFLILCPIWLVIHAFASIMAETRLFLVPQALIFIPGVLFLLSWLADRSQVAFPSLYPKPGAS